MYSSASQIFGAIKNLLHWLPFRQTARVDDCKCSLDVLQCIVQFSELNGMSGRDLFGRDELLRLLKRLIYNSRSFSTSCFLAK
jgi:hypothetical protein